MNRTDLIKALSVMGTPPPGLMDAMSGKFAGNGEYRGSGHPKRASKRKNQATTNRKKAAKLSRRKNRRK